MLRSRITFSKGIGNTRVGCLMLAAMILTGCVSGGGSSQEMDRYRTIRVEPLRDTDAARRENELGIEHLNAGDLEKAGESFGRALAADVEFGPAHNNLGKVYFKQKEWYKAAWEFEYARKLMPKHAEPHNNLGMVLERSGELDRAVDSYREAVALDGNIEYRANLVRALIRRGERTQEVRSLLQQVIDHDERLDWRQWARQQQVSLGDSDAAREADQ